MAWKFRSIWSLASRLPGRRLALAIFVLLVLAPTGISLVLWLGIEAKQPDICRISANLVQEHGELAISDIIYVLGGDYLNRVPRAVELYRKGWAPRIVIPRENMPERAQDSNKGPEHFTTVSLRMLTAAGVPPESVEEWVIGAGVSSTAEEAKALRLYLETHSRVQSVIIVTSNYHTRRAGYTARRMSPGGARIFMDGVPPAGWDLDSWWKDPVGYATVRSEYLKLLYYLPRYFFS